MKTPKNYTGNLVELKLVSAELNQMLADGSFYRLSFANRSAWIRRVKKLYNGLRGPIGGISLKPLMAAGAVSAAALLAAGCPVPDSTPAFAAPVTNPFGLTTVYSYSRPSLVDIDNDGDLDVFAGEIEGNTIFFRNTGTISTPAFAAPATNPFGLADVGTGAEPCFIDIDNDGDLDAFIGAQNGNTYYFENTGTASAPAFAASVANPFNLTAAPGGISSPNFADIDYDGDQDAIIGNYWGDTLYFQNTGTVLVPAFAAPVTNPFGLTDVGYLSSPCFADIDNDGDLDALIGNSDGNTLYFTNTGTASVPAFAASVTNPYGLTNVGNVSSPCFIDLDNDGDMDGFIGNYDGNILFFRNTAY